MGQRDRSQGFGFMYVDIAKLLKQRDELTREDAPVTTQNVVTANFNKDKTAAAPVAPPSMSTVSPSTGSKPTTIVDRTQAIAQIKENLDRLQALHHKLHAMLEELNKFSDKKSPKAN